MPVCSVGAVFLCVEDVVRKGACAQKDSFKYTSVCRRKAFCETPVRIFWRVWNFLGVSAPLCKSSCVSRHLCVKAPVCKSFCICQNICKSFCVQKLRCVEPPLCKTFCVYTGVRCSKVSSAFVCTSKLCVEARCVKACVSQRLCVKMSVCFKAPVCKRFCVYFCAQNVLFGKKGA